MRWRWFQARRAEAVKAVKESQEALVEAEEARQDAKASADYLRVERERNHFKEAVTAAWAKGLPQ